MEYNINRKKLFSRLSSLVILMFILNTISWKFYWYYTVWYFDILMHIAGGFFVTLLIFFIFKIKNFSKQTIFKIILSVFIICVSWEIYEIVFNNILAGEIFNTLDTVSDVFCGMTGSTLALIYVSQRIFIKDKNIN